MRPELSAPPCVVFEDDHLLVVNKPAGLNTHAPSPFAGEGIYDWLRNREARWANLAIIHRLDKETSGIIVFGKTSVANQSLTDQFTRRTVRKQYRLLTDRPVSTTPQLVKSRIRRVGERYESGSDGDLAETRFGVPVPNRSIVLPGKSRSRLVEVEAEPLTGRTHQIRVHAAGKGFPVLGDSLYGGSPFHRLCLHAESLSLRHPVSDNEMTFNAPADFTADKSVALRKAIIDSFETDSFRIAHGVADSFVSGYADKLGDFVLLLSESPPDKVSRDELDRFATVFGVNGFYHKTLSRNVRQSTTTDVSPRLIEGVAAPERFVIRENGIRFELSFNEGYSVGLFLDQRDNRRRLWAGHVAAGFPLMPNGASLAGAEVLNTFAYTCGFSVAAGLAGARTTSLDLSKKYLEWGRRNFKLNDLNPDQHDFIHGDVFDWIRRLTKKGRRFDVVVLDPPTFSMSKVSGAFRVEKDFQKLVASAIPLLKPAGVLFASTNASGFPPSKFVENVESAVRGARRSILQKHFAPQPPDFPITRTEPAYLKTIWVRLG